MCDFVPFTEKVVRAKDVFAERNVTISVLKRLEWFAAALLSLDVCCTVCVEMMAPYLLFAQGFSFQ